MSRMENDARDFLLRVARTLTAAFLWMLINVFIGIYMEWMFFLKTPTIGNYIFYTWLAGSLVLLLFYFRRIWGRPVNSRENPEDHNFNG